MKDLLCFSLYFINKYCLTCWTIPLRVLRIWHLLEIVLAWQLNKIIITLFCGVHWNWSLFLENLGILYFSICYKSIAHSSSSYCQFFSDYLVFLFHWDLLKGNLNIFRYNLWIITFKLRSCKLCHYLRCLLFLSDINFLSKVRVRYLIEQMQLLTVLILSFSL